MRRMYAINRLYVSDNLDISQLQVAYNIDASLSDVYDLVVSFEIKIVT